MLTRGIRAILLLVLTLACAQRVGAQERTFPEVPRDGVFVVDEAGLLDAASTEAINTRAAALLREKKIPVYVVTVRRVADHDPTGSSVDAYARLLFNDWTIGFKDYNYGILLLVSSGDRHARIELGADWKRDYDPFCTQIMDDLIVPRFKAGKFTEGIVSGVEGLDAMARGEAIPTRGFSAGFWDKINAWSGSKGFGRVVIYALAAFFVLIGRVYNRVFFGTWGWNDSSGSGGGGGGGWGGGGFGGGFSGGGGASGSW